MARVVQRYEGMTLWDPRLDRRTRQGRAQCTAVYCLAEFLKWVCR